MWDLFLFFLFLFFNFFLFVFNFTPSFFLSSSFLHLTCTLSVSHSLSPSLSTDEDSKRPRSLSDRWNDVIKRLELWVEIMELNDQGEYVAVELQPKADIKSGGIFQIRQVCYWIWCCCCWCCWCCNAKIWFKFKVPTCSAIISFFCILTIIQCMYMIVFF